MFARATIIQGPPDRIDAGMEKIRSDVMPHIRQLDGFQGIMTLVDRTSGKGLNVTFWDTEEDMRASEERANELRRQAAEGLGSMQEPQVERYEVALLEVEPGVTVR
jgi:heme-degrading monooxygenase HmoA